MQRFRAEALVATAPVVCTGPGAVGRIDDSSTAVLRIRNPNRDRRRFRLRRTVLHAVIGFAFGVLVLHPFTMFVFDWIGAYPTGEPFLLCLDWLPRSFTLEMMPMGLVFGVLTMLIFGVDGFYRSLVRFQRDELALQLDLNERQRAELEDQFYTLRKLELSKQRTTRFLVHDLKNHVGCVLGYAQQLQLQASLSGWSRANVQALEKIVRRATRMGGALKDVLHLAKLEGESRLECATIQVKELLRRSVSEAALGPGEGPARIDEAIPEDLEVACDVRLLERVIANLVLNAYQHNGPDVDVRVSASKLRRETRFVCRDTGSGIPEAMRERLFQEFTSGSRHDGHAPSFGLGLSFCKAAVEAHNGRIWFARTEGKGTTVFFSIPIRGEQGEST